MNQIIEEIKNFSPQALIICQEEGPAGGGKV